MKVVGLISGGKDSFTNLILCSTYGHETVALANLLPAEDCTEELDSFMYQTVGHNVVTAQAQCMGLPLYRRRILGASKEQGLEYHGTKGDEVEDLYRLLFAVKNAHPEIQAVSTGAIASDFQRLRVERVCARLGLISLCYLWRQNQRALLRTMIHSEVEAVLVKVAALGLEPRRHLGKTLGEMEGTLHKLNRDYQSHICGEGGEFETLVLDCPLFSEGRIVLDDTEVVMHDNSGIAPVGLLRVKSFHVEPKPGQAGVRFLVTANMPGQAAGIAVSMQKAAAC
ncbi:hypothetical protein CYMTET_50185 [Cymbomonas tetramitiformis]|uniref:Diphthine--ammonia ligase n=1 Tax=Cymbomonas tetramitiformis TaxID=36881 RepID=A0AAE0ET32_9CHLO|nr:hypothetical protein CYMTET_50185 [Cymbomonas tetramitiformis]